MSDGIELIPDEPDDDSSMGDGLAGDGLPGDPLAADSARARSKKAPNAFRTISEVADELHIPQHVLRFWETKFPQIKPLKRGGGRRYYRPDDILLLRRISDLLYIQGYTIKGVQRLLREGGGQLADDIPPAPAAERAAAEADLPEPAESLLADPAVEEAHRLRTVMQQTLDELVALRATLT